MSRSNGPTGPGGGAPPAQWRFPTEAEAAAARVGYPVPGHSASPYQQQPQAAPPQGYASSQVAPSYGAAGGLDAGYFAGGQQPAPQQPSYKPVFDRLAPAAESAPRGYDPRLAPQQQYQPQPPPPVHSSYAAPAIDPLQGLRGSTFDQWQQPAPAPPQSYDFGQYMPAGQAAPAQPYAASPGGDYGQQQHPQDYGRAQPAASYHPTAARGAAHGAALDDAHWRGGSDPAGLAPQARPPQAYAQASGQGYSQQAPQHDYDPRYDQMAAQGGQLQPLAEQAYEDDQIEYEDEEEEAPRGRRGLIIVAALIGAIGIGGGMAYAYKTFIKPSSGPAAVAKVTAPKGPSKTQPADPGGKQFANQDSKLQSRLGDGSGPITAVPPTQPIDTEGGVKRVQTQVIARDGSIVAPPPAPASTPVPGMTIVDGFNAPRPQAQAAVAAVSAVAPPVQPSVQPRPVAVPQARVPVVAAPAAVADPQTATAAPPVVKKQPAPKKPVTRDDLAAAGSGPAAAAVPAPAAAKSGVNGYVAAVASKGSRADAQRTNADLEQRFDILKGKIFDVQEADLTAQGKGVVYRSVVGPPGSRAFAQGICSQLKTVGYNDCWPVAY